MDEIKDPLERKQIRGIGVRIFQKFCDPENKAFYRNPGEITSARQICQEVLNSTTGQTINKVKELLLDGVCVRNV